MCLGLRLVLAVKDNEQYQSSQLETELSEALGITNLYRKLSVKRVVNEQDNSYHVTARGLHIPTLARELQTLLQRRQLTSPILSHLLTVAYYDYGNQ